MISIKKFCPIVLLSIKLKILLMKNIVILILDSRSV